MENETITIADEVENKDAPMLDYKVVCSCGFIGVFGELLTEPGEGEDVYCPFCGTQGWRFE